MNRWKLGYMRLKSRGAEKYHEKLELGKIRICQVPDWYLNDYHFCLPMWLAAFRQDEISRKRFEEDLYYLGARIMFAEVSGNEILRKKLQEIYDSKEADFLYRPDYFKNP